MRLYRVVSIYALLIWAYIVLRIVYSHVDMSDDFIAGIDVSFWELALSAFLTSFSAEVIGCLIEYRSQRKSR